MYTNEELVVLLSNQKKRKEFVRNYKTWGVWFVQPELNLTYYKYVLPNTTRLVVTEHLREACLGEKTPDGSGMIVCNNFYLQHTIGFDPAMPAAMCRFEDYLRGIKGDIEKELKNERSK